MESQDPKDYMEYGRRTGVPRWKIIVAVVLLVVIVLLIVAFTHPKAAGQAVGTAQQAVQTVASRQSVPDTDPELRQQNAELKKQVSDLQDQLKAKDSEIKEKDQTISTKEKQATSTEKVLADVTTDRDKYRDLYNNSPLYWDRMKKAQGWHLHFGGIISNPIDADGFHFDPTITLLVGYGPERWQVLGGIGCDMDGNMSVSIGFMWTFGDIGTEKQK